MVHRPVVVGISAGVNQLQQLACEVHEPLTCRRNTLGLAVLDGAMRYIKQQVRPVILIRNAEGRESDTHSASPIFEKVGLEPNAFEMVFCFATPRMNSKAM
jgi:hypothetical protein